MRAKPAAVPPSRLGPPRWVLAVALFGWALLLRLAFAQATPDASWPHSVLFKGDAWLWLEYAGALQEGRPFELGLPLRPPANAYLIAALWDGSAAGVRVLRWVWAALGAALPALVFLAAERPFGRRPSLLAGALCAAGYGPILLSSSLNNETPYVLLVVSSLLLLERLRTRAAPGALAAFSVLNAMAALFRAEHVLLFALLLGWLAWRRWGAERGRALVQAALAAGVFLLALAPWHLAARRALERFNTAAPQITPQEDAALASFEASLAGLAWEPEAREERERLPAFLRRHSAIFVAATVAHRGGRVVRAEDFGVLPEAFGAAPEPVRPRPLVALYGPLNFALAQHPRAPAGFSRVALEDPPPLSGGASRYPPALVGGLPPPDLAFIYPPHLALVNHGYAAGARWIAGDPGRAASLSLRKLWRFWSGAAAGFGGDDLPLGPGGTRYAVDLAVADDGPLAVAWRLALLALAAYGAVAARSAALAPWLLWLASKALVTVAFFGYTRQGAAVFPVVALLLGLAADRLIGHRLRGRPAAVALGVAAAVSVALELGRLAQRPRVFIDGLPIEAGDPFPRDLHRDQRIEVRVPR